ncbi:MAG: NADPH-dependent glutamate synthase [Candidatus Omnitrophota bacterium]
MRKQDPKDRVKNFNEVALGILEEDALKEARRCLVCKKPSCVKGCPVEIDIPAFIKLIADKNYRGAIEKIKEKNNLPAVCGRVCPQEDQCEKECILGKKGKAINIGSLERFAADWEMKNPKTPAKKGPKPSGAKVAVIGSGPAGMTCAADLARMGHKVTLFESLHEAGGVLIYGIPEFRMPKAILKREVEYIKSLGVNVTLNFLAGQSATLDDLKKDGFKAFFIATGAGLPYFLGISGEDLNGVYSANEFLTRVNLMKAYRFPEYDTPVTVGKKVAVIGSGNVAMDCARCARRLGVDDVYIVYRRTEKEMPARAEEIENAKEEGINFRLLTNPLRILGENGRVKAMECIKNGLGPPDDSGRRRPVPIEGSEHMIEVDTVICAIGPGPNPLLLKSTPQLTLNKRGNITTDENGRTSIEGVYAGGDIVTGAATVILAMGAGKKAARAIDSYLSKSQ